MAFLDMQNPAVFRQAVRNGAPIVYSVDAMLGGRPIAGATDLRPTGGSITDTTKAGVRRSLSLELACPRLELFDLLSPVGTQLRVTARVQYPNRATVNVPMGVFDIESTSLAEGVGKLSLTAPDKWARVKRAQFIRPQQSTPGLLVVAQIADLIKGALGAKEPVTITATSTALMGVLTWEKDRDKAIQDLATSIGAWVYFDRYGVATVADIPTRAATDPADWLVDASATGVLTELSRESSRTSTNNVVIVGSSTTTEVTWDPQCVWDADPGSPTYAGIDPIERPDTAGPFGISVYYYDSPTITDPELARLAGLTILARTTGLASQVSLGQVPNPAVDAFDVLDVLPPGQTTVYTPPVGGGSAPVYPSGIFPGADTYPGDHGRPGRLDYRSTRPIERHVADTVTHPLALGAQHIDGRSTRSDIYT